MYGGSLRVSSQPGCCAMLPPCATKCPCAVIILAFVTGKRPGCGTYRPFLMPDVPNERRVLHRTTIVGRDPVMAG
jgi:hypothetical protein